MSFIIVTVRPVNRKPFTVQIIIFHFKRKGFKAQIISENMQIIIRAVHLFAFKIIKKYIGFVFRDFNGALRQGLIVAAHAFHGGDGLPPPGGSPA